MGLFQLLVWLLTMLLTAVPVVKCWPSARHFGSYYNPNGFFQFTDKTHQQYYNYYEHVNHLSETNKISSNKTKSDGQHNSTFSYREEAEFGPSNWGALSASCDGMFQSPVNLVTSRARIVPKKRELDLIGLHNQPTRMRVLNEGGSAVFFPQYREQDRPRLRGGPLKLDYLFYQLHYHLGSEHTLDGKRFAAEVHLVFFNSLYDSFDSARDQVDGVTVIALTYDVLQGNRIETLNKWTRYLGKVVREGSEYSMPQFALFPLSDVTRDVAWPYFSYEGSLTTPPCSETVLWIVASERMPLTKSELNRMRQLKGRGGEWVQNFRPTQPSNYRRVFIY